jgi:hypothetical protein|tara:strand:- start:6403 stop:6678 length:276 start_codon:yes stop_codon:yes gene_type:complete
MNREDKNTFLRILGDLYNIELSEEEHISQSDIRRTLRIILEKEHLKRYKMEEKDCILRIPLTYDELKNLKSRVDDVFDVAPYVKKLIDENE